MTAFRKCKNKRCSKVPPRGMDYCSRNCSPFGNYGLYANGKAWPKNEADPARFEREAQRKLERPKSIYEREWDWGGR